MFISWPDTTMKVYFLRNFSGFMKSLHDFGYESRFASVQEAGIIGEVSS